MRVLVMALYAGGGAHTPRRADSREPVPTWKSTTEAARVLGITAATLYRLIDSGALRAYRFGRVIRIKTADLDAYLASVRSDRRGAESRNTQPGS